MESNSKDEEIDIGCAATVSTAEVAAVPKTNHSTAERATTTTEKITSARARERQQPAHLAEYQMETPHNKRKLEDFVPHIGMPIRKEFDDGEFYLGKVIAGPEETEKQGKIVLSWRVCYEDDDEEDLSKSELLTWATLPDDEPPRKKAPSQTKTNDYAATKKDLCYKMGVTEEEVENALKQMKPPYGRLNHAMQLIHQAKKQQVNGYTEDIERFEPRVGLRIRKSFGGSAYHGTVTNDGAWLEVDGDKVKMWEVTYEDGDKEDMEFHDLMAWRASRAIRMHPVRGRQLSSLELFSGCGVVTQEFAERKWRVRSIDNSPTSYATDNLDVMKLQYNDIDMVPDFIWASPPCFTYSNLAGGKHRNPEQGQFEKTLEAREHNRLLVQMFAIMKWARFKNPHLIVVIENPAGTLRKMPLMKKIVEEMGLYATLVNYCALGRDDKKPTYIWTNDFRLHGTLNEFKCMNKCPYYGGIHPIGARQHGRQWNAAAIPKALAEEVAEHVHSTFYERRIRYTKDPEMGPEEVEEFNKVMAI